MGPPETYTFSADIAQLMGVIVSTVYANKEIFLRELVSNASDALERRQHEADGHLPAGDACIRVYPDAAAGTLTVEDSGIGMSREDLVDSLGTIARSKTKAFLEAATAGGADPALIGQFGIGFYSAYVVSERVRVVSRTPGSGEQHVWESTAGGSFTVSRDDDLEHGSLQAGTKVVCFLKDGQREFLDSGLLRQLLMRHSCFVKWPLYLYADRGLLDPSLPAADVEERTLVEATAALARGWELMSRIKPVWLEAVADVTADEYDEVYRWLEGDLSVPEALAVRHVEGSGTQQVDFRALLFCARRAPSDIFDLVEGRTRGSRVRLFVRRVFVKEFDDLLPKWMAFACGVVDSDDLPLNISREQLQRESAVMRLVGRLLARHCFEMLESLAVDPAKYAAFHEMFGQNLKLGVYEDAESRARLFPLLRFRSTESGEDLVSLQQYVDRMRPTQQHILYVTGRSRRQAMQSPLIEGFRRDGFEVLLMTDPADEFALQVLKEFGGRELMSATTVHAASEGSGVPPELAARDGAKHLQSLEGLRCFLEETLAADGRECDVGFVAGSASGGAFPAVMQLATPDRRPSLELDASHGLFHELAKKLAAGAGEVGQAERALVVLLHEMASALSPAQEGADSVERRRRAGEQLQAMVRRLDGADRDADDEDVPAIPLEPLASTGGAGARALGCGGRPSAPRAATPTARWPSVGSRVRVAQGERSRRGIVTFLDDERGTVDVLLSASYGAAREDGGVGEEEEELDGLLMTQVLQPLAFEAEHEMQLDIGERPPVARGRQAIVDTLSRLKEEGNHLYKLQDFDAALERYTLAVDAARGSGLDVGQRVLRVAAVDGHRLLTRSTVQRLLPTRSEALFVDVEDEAGGRSVVPVASVLPVLGLRSLRPVLERARALKGLGESVLAQIAALAAEPADATLELVSLQAALFANRARCWTALGRDRRAAQDLTAARGLWEAFATSRQLDSLAPDAAVVRGLCTAEYLRARTRLRRGLAPAAARDVRDALAREPPAALAKQLQGLQIEVWKALSERRRVREPLARELAKVVFGLRTASL